MHPISSADAPALGPEKGVRNEPCNIITSVAAIAAVKKISEADVTKAMQRNAQHFWRLV